ncbi:MAG: redoxin domain-containing protein [Candidatus Sumerlaeia bacterium]|nr:redoxin domain-containing protein [Candidatus Sumerlaeia bacterium]
MERERKLDRPGRERFRAGFLLAVGLGMTMLMGCGGPLISDPEAVDLPSAAIGVHAENANLKPRRRPIAAGEPVPSFLWFDQAGRAVTTAELVTGGDALLIFTAGDDAPHTRPVYEWVRRNKTHATRSRCEILVVTPDGPDRNAQVAAGEQLGVAVLHDPSSWSARVFGVAPARGGTVERPWSVLLGREGKVLEVTPGLFETSAFVTALTVRKGAQDEFRAIDLLRKD